MCTRRADAHAGPRVNETGKVARGAGVVVGKDSGNGRERRARLETVCFVRGGQQAKASGTHAERNANERESDREPRKKCTKAESKSRAAGERRET